MTINNFHPPSPMANIDYFQLKGRTSMRYRLNALSLKQKIFYCLAAYVCGVALAWLIDCY
ncbi:hypothetical protein FJD36_29260 [Pseudomonas chlororaphis subsp. chlororaphis]|nr:hypothetical protein FJD36_29260 [Pseudomonas chlororaphis subsp. chlororaphis]